MNVLFAIAGKDLRLLCRDKGAAFFTFGFPLLVAVMFGFLFGGGGGQRSGLSIGVFDEDEGAASAAFVEDLAASDGLEVTKLGSRAEAETGVRKGKFDACVIVPKGFGEQSENMFAGEAMKLEGLVDPRHEAEAGLVTGKLNEIAFKQMTRGFTDGTRMSSMIQKARTSLQEAKDVAPGRKMLFGAFFDALSNMTAAQEKLKGDQTDDQKAEGATAAGGKGDGEKKPSAFAFKPVDVTVRQIKPEDNQPQSSFEITFPQGIVWGLMGCVTGFGASLATERSQGTLMRLLAAPINSSQVLLGKALGCFLACLLVQAVLLLAGVLAFGVHVRQPGLLVLAMVCAAFGFVGVMMVMASLTRTEGAAQGLGRGLIIVLAMIGGGTLPLAFMPPIMKTLSNLSPFKWATDAIEGAVWRQLSLTEMLAPCGVLVGIGVAGYVIGALGMRLADSK